MAGPEGLHHVTAIAGEPQANIDFYAGVLGLRLVKVTVNFDDPTTYHLYYGDGQGHPGTILTFFPWRGAPKGRIGTGQLTITSFAVPEQSLPYWRRRFQKRGVEFKESISDFGEEVLFLRDPDGLQLELISSPMRNRITSGSEDFSDESLRSALKQHEKRATTVLELEEKVGAVVKKLKERGLVSPYLRSFVVARINPLRWIKGEPPPLEDVLKDVSA